MSNSKPTVRRAGISRDPLAPPEAPPTAPDQRHEAAAEIMRRYDDPAHRPIKDWNSLSSPTPGDIYDRSWKHRIRPEDEYPAFRGFDTRQTRAMRMAADAAAHGEHRLLTLSTAAYMQTEAAIKQRRRFHEELKKAGLNPTSPPPNEDEAAIIRIYHQHGRAAAERTLSAFADLLQTGTDLIFIGLNRDETATVAAGLAMMHEAKLLLEDALTAERPAPALPPFERWRWITDTTAPYTGESAAPEVRRFAAHTVNITEFAKLEAQRPPYEPEACHHPLELALGSIHEHDFRWRQGEPYRRATLALSLGQEAQYLDIMQRVQEHHQEILRLHSNAAQSPGDDEFWEHYKAVRDTGTPADLQNWTHEAANELYSMENPEGMTAQALWRYAAANFRKRPDNPQGGLSLTAAMLENAYLLPIIRGNAR